MYSDRLIPYEIPLPHSVTMGLENIEATFRNTTLPFSAADSTIQQFLKLGSLSETVLSASSKAVEGTRSRFTKKDCTDVAVVQANLASLIGLEAYTVFDGKHASAVILDPRQGEIGYWSLHNHDPSRLKYKSADDPAKVELVTRLKKLPADSIGIIAAEFRLDDTNYECRIDVLPSIETIRQVSKNINEERVNRGGVQLTDARMFLRPSPSLLVLHAISILNELKAHDPEKYDEIKDELKQCVPFLGKAPISSCRESQQPLL